MRRPGFALIAVFWIVMVVGLFTAIVASRTGFDIDRSRWALDMGRVRAAADGAVEEAAFRMVERLGSGQPVTDLAGVQELDLRIDDIPVHVTIQDEDGKIDLGQYAVEQLALSLDPFPRKPGAEFVQPEEPAEISPFAALKALKPRDEQG